MVIINIIMSYVIKTQEKVCFHVSEVVVVNTTTRYVIMSMGSMFFFNSLVGYKHN